MATSDETTTAAVVQGPQPWRRRRKGIGGHQTVLQMQPQGAHQTGLHKGICRVHPEMRQLLFGVRPHQRQEPFDRGGVFGDGAARIERRGDGYTWDARRFKRHEGLGRRAGGERKERGTARGTSISLAGLKPVSNSYWGSAVAGVSTIDWWCGGAMVVSHSSMFRRAMVLCLSMVKPVIFLGARSCRRSHS